MLSAPPKRAAPDLSAWGLWCSYCHNFPLNAAFLIALSLVWPIESLLAPIFIGKLTASISDRAPRATIIRNLFYIGILSVVAIVLYQIDLFASQAFSVRLVTHIQEQLVKYIFVTRDVGADCVPSTELAVRMRVFASFMAKRINLFRNNIFPGLFTPTLQGGYLAIRIDWALGCIIFTVVMMLILATWISMNSKSHSSIRSSRADEASITRIGDVLDNFATVVDHDGLCRELKALDVLHKRAHDARTQAVAESMGLSVTVNCVAGGAAVVFFVRLYRKFLASASPLAPASASPVAPSSGAKTHTGAKSDVAVTATAMILETLASTRSLLFHLYDLAYGNASLHDARQKFLEGAVSYVCTGDIKCAARVKCGKCACGKVRPGLRCLAGPKHLEVPPAGESAVRLEGVSFAYPSASSSVLENVSLNFLVGERTALVGQNGSGKTTVLRLILRHAVPQSGEIYLFGHPYSGLRPRTIRDHIAYANQFPILFDRTIYENISYPKPKLGRAEIEAIVESAGLSGFYASFPLGLDTKVGRHGDSLSGGQRQLVQLTRILVQDAPIVILDEVTSSVDDVHEQLIANLIITRFTGKTIILVSHDPDFRAAVSTQTLNL